MSYFEFCIKIKTYSFLFSDSFKPYLDAVELFFGGDVDFAQLIKVFAGGDSGSGRYSPSKIKGVLSMILRGKPNERNISTSYVERQNLTIRMHMRRFTRLTNAFSKKVKNLKAALALHFAHHNFIRVHSSLQVTFCIAAGITGTIWSWEDLAEDFKKVK